MMLGVKVTRKSIMEFVNSLKTYGAQSLKDIVIRRFMTSMLKFMYGQGRIPSWSSQLENLLRRERFVLVVLASCRYDFFAELYGRYFKGKLKAVKSPGTFTVNWWPKILYSPEFTNIRLFHNPVPIFPHNWEFNNVKALNKHIEIVKLDFGHPLKPRSTREILKDVLSYGLSKRNVIYLMSSHFPWRCDLELSRAILREVALYEFTPEEIIHKTLKAKGIPRERIIKAYFLNLVETLGAVNWFLKQLSSRYSFEVVLTSDHGELLGEYHLYLHPHYELPQLYIVPWLEVEEVM